MISLPCLKFVLNADRLSLWSISPSMCKGIHSAAYLNLNRANEASNIYSFVILMLDRGASAMYYSKYISVHI